MFLPPPFVARSMQGFADGVRTSEGRAIMIERHRRMRLVLGTMSMSASCRDRASSERRQG
jgi:hypothetical protein